MLQSKRLMISHLISKRAAQNGTSRRDAGTRLLSRRLSAVHATALSAFRAGPMSRA